MKRLLLLLAVICLITHEPVRAQLEQGSILTGVTSTVCLGGWYGSELMSLGFVTNKYGDSDPYKAVTLNLLPKAGYFFADNFVAGLDIIMSLWTEQNKDDDYKETDLTIAAGPFARLYFPLENLYPFVEANVAAGTVSEKYKSGSYESEYKSSAFMFGFGVGAAKPLGERVSLDASLGYSHVALKEKDEGEEVDNVKNTSGGIGLKLGFTVFFNR